jgi:hypothetical protein
MTILAGIVSRDRGETIDRELRRKLRHVISRHSDEVIELGDGCTMLAKVDIGAFDARAAIEDRAGNLSLLAGEPIFHAGSGRVSNRAEDLEQLHEQWTRAEWRGLSACSGTFCAAHYDPRDHRLTLIADKLGLRPIYYWVGAKLVVFATSLRILEELEMVPLEMDLRGATEIACFGYPLAQRSGYVDVSTIGAGEVVGIAPAGVRRETYWRWDRLIPFSGNDLAGECHQRFERAVRDRLRGDRAAVAFLSGGLDSRAVVSALRSLGVRVETLNFALEGTQDRVFAREMAGALGTAHHQLDADFERMYAFRGRAYNQHVVGKWFESRSSPSDARQRRVVWSGDGGSCGVGHIYLDPETIGLAQAGATEAALASFLRYNHWFVSNKLHRREFAERVAQVPRLGVLEEISGLECADRGRALHLFLMLNDQRRHMANHFENIDVDRLEFQMPFYDSDFLEPILSSPVNQFLRHEFYMRWLETFPAELTSFPWQAYPGHVPCTLPSPPELRYQWTDDYYARNLRREARRRLLREIEACRATECFPDAIVDKARLTVVSWLTRLGIRDYEYLLKTVAVYCRFRAGCRPSVSPG